MGRRTRAPEAASPRQTGCMPACQPSHRGTESFVLAPDGESGSAFIRSLPVDDAGHWHVALSYDDMAAVRPAQIVILDDARQDPALSGRVERRAVAIGCPVRHRRL